MNSIKSCGFEVKDVISDESNLVQLQTVGDVAVAVYVDNLAVIGCPPRSSTQASTRLPSV